MGFESKVPTKKYGNAKDVPFGCPEMSEFLIVESVSATSSFQTNQMLKNEVGISVGQVLGDPKLEATISGAHNEAPFTLGQIANINLFVGDVEGGEQTSSSEGATAREVVITSVKQDNSNEDFMKFEVSAEFYHNVDLSDPKDLRKGADDH